MIKKFDQFSINEFNKFDKDKIQSLPDDYFTVAIEYEVCANENPEDEPIVSNLKKSAKYAKESTMLSIKRKMSYGFKFDWSVPEMDEFVDDIMSQVLEYYYEDEDEDVYDDILDSEQYETNTEKFIIDTIASNVMKFFDSQNMEYLINQVKKNMPLFYKKYNKSFKYELEGDNEKQRILEFSPKTYIPGLEKAVQQVNDFFDEFENQPYWYFNQRTSVHFNVGIKDGKLNPLKGLMLLSDFNRDKKVPFVFKGIENRLPNIHVGSMVDKLKELLGGTLDKKLHKQKRELKKLSKYKGYLQQNVDKLDLNNLPELESFLNEILLKANIDFWVKEFGLNITQYQNNYVEFRFVGDDVKREVVLEKLYYFAYITYAMSSEYKHKEYTKALYKFVEDVKGLIS